MRATFDQPSCHGVLTIGAALLIGLLCPVRAAGQRNDPAPTDTAATTTARAAAPIDLTGYWVSVVTQDWRWRMVTPAKGDYESVPITLEAKTVGDGWDPAKDEAVGEACRGYGAPAIMAIPARLHITWADDQTLQVEIDAGTQTRRFHFGAGEPSDTPPSWQGVSTAVWEPPRSARGERPVGGSLKVTTRNARPGYLRKNGIPYSGHAVVTEYWDLGSERDGVQWITLTSLVEDAQYLRRPYVTALHFKKEADGSKWDPTPCTVK